MLKNELTKRLRIEYPIIQAPMAGGVTTSDLVSAVSNNGGLGMVGAGYMSPEKLRAQINEINTRTSKNFGVNLFVPNDFYVTNEKMELAESLITPIQEKLNMSKEHIPTPTIEVAKRTYREQIQVIIEENVSVCSFTFGIPSDEIIQVLKQHHILVIGTATTVNEAVALEEAGMDMIVAQGSEAGGHRGNFLGDMENSLIGLMSLIPQVKDHVSIPVIAAGGIMDGRGILASRCLGAEGVQMGTAFLTCIESGANQLYKEAILESSEDMTVLTRAFSGKWARGVSNRFIQEMKEKENDLPDYPIQNALTQPLRKASALQGDKGYMSLWSGQTPRLAQNQTVEELMTRIIEEIDIIEK